MKFYLHTIWVLYKGEREFNCADAWDEALISDNAQGFDEKVAEFEANPDVAAVRVVLIGVSETDLRAALSPSTIEGTVDV